MEKGHERREAAGEGEMREGYREGNGGRGTILVGCRIVKRSKVSGTGARGRQVGQVCVRRRKEEGQTDRKTGTKRQMDLIGREREVRR